MPPAASPKRRRLLYRMSIPDRPRPNECGNVKQDDKQASLFLLRLELLDVFLWILVERVLATGAANIECLAIETDRDRSQSAADNAFNFLFFGAQAFTFFVAGNLE